MLARLDLEAELNPGRQRKSETAEKLVDCVAENCLKQKTYRAIAKHFKSIHSTNKLVLALKCNIPSCEWYCYKNLGCFTIHMRKVHGVKISIDSELTMIQVVKKSSKHSGHCSQTRAKVLAEHIEKEKAVRLANKERKGTAKEADQIAKKKAKADAKKLVKDVEPEIPANNSKQTVNIVMNGPITV